MPGSPGQQRETHHAMVRLAGRCEVRTPDDLLEVIGDIWRSQKDKLKAMNEGEHPAVLQVPFAGGIAVMERTEEFGHIVKTILSPEMVSAA